MDFNGIIPAVQTGNVDIAIAGITITDEREEIVDFSDPYYDSGLQILVARRQRRVETIDDLEGMKIGTKIGSTSYRLPDREIRRRRRDHALSRLGATCTWP